MRLLRLLGFARKAERAQALGLLQGRLLPRLVFGHGDLPLPGLLFLPEQCFGTGPIGTRFHVWQLLRCERPGAPRTMI